MPRPAERERAYMAGLDGLRAVAVLAVIAYHLRLPFAPGGLLGVGVFFVLSGYLITDILVDQWEATGRIDLRGFWLRRARRLLPALFLMLAAVVAYVAFWDPLLLPELRGGVLAAVLYVSNWWFIGHQVSYFARWGPPSLLGHLWSLAVEEQFYLAFPLLLWFGLQRTRRRWHLAVAALVLAAASALWMAHLFQPGRDPTRVYDGTDTRAFSLLLGAAAALLVPSRRLARLEQQGAVRLLDLLGLAGLAGIALFVACTTEVEPFLYRGGMVLLSLATVLPLFAAAQSRTLVGRALALRPLTWLGVRSYGIYLWHYPVIALATAGPRPGGSLVRAAAEVALSIALAALSWRFVEEPVRHGALLRLLAAFRSRRRWTEKGGRRLIGLGAAGSLALSFCFLTFTGAVPGSEEAPTRADAVLPTGQGLASARTAQGPGARPAAPHLPAGEGVTAVGDSVLIDATPYLKEFLPGIVVDAAVGRQMVAAPGVLRDLQRRGELGRRVLVLALGTNGPFPRSFLRHLLAGLAVGRVVLVNTRVPRPWQAEVNQALAWAARSFPHVILVDWYAASAGQSSWFYPDMVHLNPTGAEAYARLVARAVMAAERGLLPHGPKARHLDPPKRTALPPKAGEVRRSPPRPAALAT